MSEPWRTETVTQLCQAMRETQDWTALPILADALGDAGCRDEELLEKLRINQLPVNAQRLVAQVYSAESAAAVQWFDDFVLECGEGGYPGRLPVMTYAMLLEAAMRYVETGDDGLGDGSMNWSNTICDRDKEFWANYERVTGTKGPQNMGGFLTCQC